MLNVRISEKSKGYWIDDGYRAFFIDNKQLELVFDCTIHDEFFDEIGRPVHSFYDIKVGDSYNFDQILKHDGTVIYSDKYDQVLLCKNGRWYHGSNPSPTLDREEKYTVLRLGDK